MITVNNIEMKLVQCDVFKYPVTVNELKLFSSAPFTLSGDVEIINHQTRVGTKFKLDFDRPVRHLNVFKFVSDNVLPVNVTDPLPEKLTEMAERLDCYILNPEAFDGRYVLIGVDGMNKPAASYFTVSGVQLAAFYVTVDFQPSPLKDEHVKTLLRQLPDLSMVASLTSIAK